MKPQFYKTLIGCIICTCSLKAQSNINWVLGPGNGNGIFANQNISFSTGTPIADSLGTQNRLFTTSTSISDSNGNLLFYTNGINVYNSLGDTMINGTGLSPSSWTNNYLNLGLNLIQAVVTIPKPGSSTEYYLIHQSIDSSIIIPTFPYFIFYATRLYYSIIDMSLNGGLGEVTQKNVNILTEFDTIVYGGLTCCRHANGRDWWLISHGYQNDEYYKWLITPNGFQGPYKQSIGPVWPYGLSQCKFSPDGKKYASVIDWNNNYIYSVWLYNFDRCSGTLDSSIQLIYQDSLWLESGCEFSGNSKFLYACTGRYLFQWDLAASNIPQSKLLIDSAQNFYDSLLGTNSQGNFFLMQRAINDKIYLTTSSGTSVLHYINYPDSLGQSCNFIQHQFQLPCYNFQTIPNQVNFNLGADSGSVCDTLTGITYIPAPNKRDIVVFPNPAKDLINVGYDLPKNQIATINIYNNYGTIVRSAQIVGSGNYAEIKISVAKLSSGLYAYLIVAGVNINHSSGKVLVIK